MKKIADYGFISDCHTAALVDRHGSIDWYCVPRFEYGLTIPRLAPGGSGLTARAGPVTLQLASDIAWESIDGAANARFEIEAGQSPGFALSYTATCGGEPPAPIDDDAALADTLEGWTSWSDQRRGYDGLYVPQVRRSAVVLQGLTYQPSGAIVAAATTSLPEVVGGEANWDYRFAWLRDFSLTLRTQWVAACPDEPTRFFSWMAGALGRLEDQPVQIMYGVEGERDLTERALTHLQGFHGSQPVRVGNGAWDQKQLDVMGEVLDAAHLLKDYLGDLRAGTKELLVGFADRAADQWREPDAGMWEARGKERHYVSSKVLCWLALDRASRLAPLLESESEVERWNKARDEIHETVLDEGWSDRPAVSRGRSAPMSSTPRCS